MVSTAVRRGATRRVGPARSDLHGHSALHELIRQNEYARSNRHNLAVVRGTPAIDRLLKLTGVEDLLVLVDDPEDLVPPPIDNGASA